VSLLGGASESDTGVCLLIFQRPNFGDPPHIYFSQTITRPERGKAGAFLAALADGAAEPEPAKRKRQRAAGKRATQDDDMSADDEVYKTEAEQGGDEEDESDDSDVEMVVDGEEVQLCPQFLIRLDHLQLAATLTAKTDPKAGKTRRHKTGKAAGKGEAKAVPKTGRKPAAKKSKTQATYSNPPINIVPARNSNCSLA
jgi:hypothetical protein